MSQVQATLDHLFRRQSGQMVAYLTRFFGPDQLDLAESVVQEALMKAVQAWPIQGIPENPEAWIMRAAKNSAIDHIRKSRDLPHETDVLDSLAEDFSESKEYEAKFRDELRDDQLKLIFICCHPALSREARSALTLKTLCGFGVQEIARAFLAKEESIAQRIVRAKQKIADLNLKYEVPEPAELESRLDSVLEVLYLLFNEGYLATAGESLMRRDLCEEAIFRTTALTENSIGKQPKVFALLALMHFQISRFDSRLDRDGELLLLEEQDRTLWDQEHIHLGLMYLDLSAEGDELSDYHLQSGIASCHAMAKSFEATDWQRILSYYDVLLGNEHSPIVALNRAVAVAMAHGMDAGLEEIEGIKDIPPLKSYYLMHATTAELFRRNGNLKEAKNHYERALELVGTEPEKRLILRRIAVCKEHELKIVRK
jgi:RNA polymerase sigma-70 factor (ECF subfamily)